MQNTEIKPKNNSWFIPIFLLYLSITPISSYVTALSLYQAEAILSEEGFSEVAIEATVIPGVGEAVLIATGIVVAGYGLYEVGHYLYERYIGYFSKANQMP